MKEAVALRKHLADSALQAIRARQEGQEVSDKAINEMWSIAAEGIAAGVVGSEWLGVGCMTIDQFMSMLRAPRETVSPTIAQFLTKHYCDKSDFSQQLRHTHSVDDPPLGSNSVFGDVGPDRWGYIYKDPNNRMWLPSPTVPLPAPGSSWTNYNFSWIYACKTDAACTPDTTGGRTELIARFGMDVELDHKGAACVEITSRVSSIGYGGYAYLDPLSGVFGAHHRLCIALYPTAVVAPQGRFVYHASREVWRVSFDSAHPHDHVWSGDGSAVYGAALGGSASSELSCVVPVNGPSKIHVTEEISYTVDLTEGGLRCPLYPALFGIQGGLFGALEPLCWQLKGLCGN